MPQEPLYKMVDGQRVQLTNSEVAIRLAEEAAWAAEQPTPEMREREARIAPYRTVRAWQAKAAIEAQGHLPAVEAALAGMPEGVEKVVATAAWNNAADFDIDSPTVVAIANAIGITEEQREALFVFGASLEL